MKLAKRISKIEESVTMKLDAKARAMEGVINLTAGEPHFLPPEPVLQATGQAAFDGKTKYTSVRGTEALRQAIAKKFRAQNFLEYDPKSQIIVTPGAKFAVFAAVAAVTDPGEEVLILSPYWTSYPEMVKLCGGIPHYFDSRKIEKLVCVLDEVTPKAIILNSPNNPSGKVFTKEELEFLADVLGKRNIWIISDEVYEPIVFGGRKHISIASLNPEIKARTIVVNGVSKSHAMTGYRIGYAGGPENVIAGMAKLQSQMIGCPCSISQEAALAGLNSGQTATQKMAEAYEEAMENIVLVSARKMGVEYFEPEGAFYFFFKLPKKFGGDCLDFCDQILAEEKVALVPGVAFGYPGWVRLCYAADADLLKEAMRRLLRFLKK